MEISLRKAVLMKIRKENQSELIISTNSIVLTYYSTIEKSSLTYWKKILIYTLAVILNLTRK